MRLLELFSGTGSVRKAVGDRFEEVVSLDICFDATIKMDIRQWDYKVYPPGYFDVIWASPPCQEFSCLNNARPEKVPNYEWADSLVRKAIEIIEYFQPAKFFIENPQTGCLKDRDYMMGIPFVDVDYCQFSDWGYRKRTRIWTNVDHGDRVCGGSGECKNMEGGRHKKAIGNSTYDELWVRGKRGEGRRLQQRYSIPPKLIQSLFDAEL